MVDVATALLGAGLGLAQKLIVLWVQSGTSRVRARRRAIDLASEVQLEASRLQVRAEELELVTKAMIARIVASSPELSYSRFPFRRSLRVELDSTSALSGALLIEQLEKKVSLIAAEHGLLWGRALVAETGVLVTPNLPVANLPKEVSRSQQLMDELQGRIRGASEDRE